MLNDRLFHAAVQQIVVYWAISSFVIMAFASGRTTFPKKTMAPSFGSLLFATKDNNWVFFLSSNCLNIVATINVVRPEHFQQDEVL